MTTSVAENHAEHDHAARQSPPHAAEQAASAPAPCPSCAGHGPAAPEQFVYALGRIEARFPSLALEREYQQRERALGAAADAHHHARMRAVLEQNPHIAAQLCYVFKVGGSPAYILAPAGHHLRQALFEAIAMGDAADGCVVAVGRIGPMAPASACSGILAPVVLCDQIYTFQRAEWLKALSGSLAKALEERQIESPHFAEVASELFTRLTQSTENVGASDAHRALNYLIMQHPGMFLAVAERRHRHVLDRIDTRIIQVPSARRQVAVILSFVETSTGLTERLFTRVDVTEEWPFVADAESGRGALGLMPYLENTLLGMPL